MSEDPPTIAFVDAMQNEYYKDRDSRDCSLSETVNDELPVIDKKVYYYRENCSTDETQTLNAEAPQDVNVSTSQSPETISINEAEVNGGVGTLNGIRYNLDNWKQWKKEQASTLSDIIQEAKSLEDEDEVSMFMEYYFDNHKVAGFSKSRGRLINSISANLDAAKGIYRDILSTLLETLNSIQDNSGNYGESGTKFLSFAEKLGDNSLLKGELYCLAGAVADEEEFLRAAQSVIEIVESHDSSKRQSFVPAIDEIRESIKKLNTRIEQTSEEDMTRECISVAADARRFTLILDRMLSQQKAANVAETTRLKILIIERSVILDGIDKILAGRCPEKLIKKYCLDILSAVDNSCIAAQKIVADRERHAAGGARSKYMKKRAVSLTCVTARNSSTNSAPPSISSAVVPGARTTSISADIPIAFDWKRGHGGIVRDASVSSSPSKDSSEGKNIRDIQSKIQSKIRIASIDQSPPKSTSIEHGVIGKPHPRYLERLRIPKGRSSFPTENTKESSPPSTGKSLNAKSPPRNKASWIEELARVQISRAAPKSATLTTDNLIKHDYCDDTIEFSANGKVITGTLEALVERLTLHDQVLDRFFTSTFLSLFREFTTTNEFLSLLIKRFTISPPENITEAQLALWKDKKQIPVRLRTYNVLRLWVESYWIPDVDDQCLPDIRKFAVEKIPDLCNNLSRRLVELVDKRIYGETPTVVASTDPIRPMDVPTPILPKHKIYDLLDLDALEVARQLTLVVCKLFTPMKPQELVGQAWNKKDEKWKKVSSNVGAVISMSNKITFWVVSTILGESDVGKRASYIKFFIKLCTKLAAIHNYDTLMAVKSAIDMSCIARLRRTWDNLPNKMKNAYEQISLLLDFRKNFSNYRTTIKNMIPPCMPFLGLCLTDLTFVENGLATYREVNGKKLINFSKFVKIYKIIHSFQSLLAPFPFKEIPQIQRFILDRIHNVEALSSSKYYELSLKLEPKEVGRKNSQSTVDAKVKALQKAGLLKSQ